MFCRQKGKYQYCVHNYPKMTARRIVKLQMKALQDNDKKNSGIRTAYRFASPDNKRETGPLSKFTKMLYSKTYKHLLNCVDWRILGKGEKNRGDTQYSCRVRVKSNNGNTYLYRFNLSRQYDWQNNQPLYDKENKEELELFWRTDSVLLLSTMESFQSGGDKNIDNGSLKMCSNDPLTGFYRDGYCRTGSDDIGTHTVCAKVDRPFLDFTKDKGNDLTSTNYNFPGLKPGDYWCLCANRYKEAKKAGYALKVNRKATHKKTLNYVSNI